MNVIRPGNQLLYKEEVYAVVGAAMEVHNELGCGFLEAVYQEALEIELAAKQIPFEALKPLPVWYKGIRLKKCYVADLIGYEKIVVELKAIEKLTVVDDAQLLNYLKATGYELGLLINFGSPKLEWERKILTKHSKGEGTRI